MSDERMCIACNKLIEPGQDALRMAEGDRLGVTWERWVHRTCADERAAQVRRRSALP